MSTIAVTQPRWTVDGGRVLIPATRNWLVVGLLCVWLTGWTYGGVQAFRAVAERPDTFLTVWLVGWLGGELAVLLTILWQILGRELVEVSSGKFILRSEIAGVGRTQEFELAGVVDLRAVPVSSSPWGKSGRPPWGKDSGAMAFDYGAKTYRFGGSLEEAEAKQLVQHLASIAPQLRKSP